MARFTGTTTTLAANGVWISDILNITSEDVVSGTVISPQAGTLYAEFSADGGKTWAVKETFNIIAGTPFTTNVATSRPYCRLRYVNGPDAQTSFKLTFRASDPGSKNTVGGTNRPYLKGGVKDANGKIVSGAELYVILTPSGDVDHIEVEIP